jgi:Fis family transcriptional regulator
MTGVASRTNNKPPARSKRGAAQANGAARRATTSTPLQQSVASALADYFETLDGEPTERLYELVMAEVERPLLEAVMGQVGDNQTRAATMLGLNRGTLRKKLMQHGLLDG